MNKLKVDGIVKELSRLIRTDDYSPFNYERNLLVDKAPYLDAFIENRPFPPFEVEIQIRSKCNLQCVWCIGREVQEQRRVLQLADNINENNIDALIDDIINFRLDNLGIKMVKFSGFIGEPLLNENTKKITINAIKRLTSAGIKVVLFTNGVLLNDKITWESLVNIDSVHISLDAGPLTYSQLKEQYNKDNRETFTKVLDNIKELSSSRKINNGRVQINIGFIIVPDNYKEIYKVTQLVKKAGADSIRFKVDIVGKFDLQKARKIKEVYREIEKIKNDFHKPPSFSVYIIHSEEDVINKSYVAWQCKDGCFFHHFHGTIGSDGNVYLCNFNTIPSAIPFGSALNRPLKEIWEDKQRMYIISGIPYTCQCNVCPPFGNRLNFFLKKIQELKEQYGIINIQKAIQILRNQYREIK